MYDDDPTAVAHFKRVFPCLFDPTGVGAQARAVALSKSSSSHSPRTQKVSLVRIDYVNYQPAPWRQSRPHWALDVGGDLYHLLAVPRDEGDLQSATCCLAWVLTHTMPVGQRHPLGVAALSHQQIVDALCHVIDAFDGNDGIDTVFWHCGAFLRAVVAALCQGVDIEAVDDPTAEIDEAALRDGLFALRRHDHVAAIRADNGDNDRVQSRAAIAATLPVDEPSWFAGCVLA
ncbi:hypothetical protein psal_cds_1104 [Pandoravirus salinus]|uniref:Uncharacterized protein n=1 Tax=Pandoravirus salinus TaxID=1349410 RepID=S4VXC7_9VIRU|nr:hypothetical protein psal_cds_1104 [Pandoravirus salinus]AGO85329.1 hypothetical protein psal_cds_1104 [Pandoravirus salinus]